MEGASAVAGTLFLYCAYFWTRTQFGFNKTHNLLLTSTQAFVCILLTRVGGRFSDRGGYDRMLAACFLGMAVTLLVGWRLPRGWLTPFLIVAELTIVLIALGATGIGRQLIERPLKANSLLQP